MLVLFVRWDSVCFCRYLWIMWSKHISLRVHKIIRTRCVHTLGLLEHLCLHLLSNIDIIILSPLLTINIIHITVIVSHFCTTLVDEYWVENVWLCANRLITMLNFLLDVLDFACVMCDFLSDLLMVGLQCVQKLRCDLVLQFWEYKWLLMISNLKLHLISLWFEKLHRQFQIFY